MRKGKQSVKYWIGTSGFQYPEWKRKFYPEKMPAPRMLGFYSERFNSTEINYTFRRLPSAKAVSEWQQMTPEDFRFSFKAPQRITHFARLKGCSGLLKAFHRSIFKAEGKLGPILFQLPPNFRLDAQVLKSFLRILPPQFKSAFEFRDPSWFTEEVYSLLRDYNCALCIAESKELKTPLVLTSDFGYLRLRREDYRHSNLEKWAKFIESKRKEWKEVYVYFKHEERALGPKYAEKLMRLLKG
jgi:uncharacterized protein YecE (DUF72 family)